MPATLELCPSFLYVFDMAGRKTVNRWRKVHLPTQTADMQMNPCKILEQRIASVLEPRPEVLEAYLFGSHAHGAAQPHSDIDVAVYIDETVAEEGAFGYRAQLITEIMADLRSNDIDLLILNRAPPVLYYHVLRDGIRVLSRDLAATTTRERYAVSRYCDYAAHRAKTDEACRLGALRE